MPKLATSLALLTVIGAMGASSMSFAAPPPVDCKDPANAKNPACMAPMNMHKGKPGPGMQMQPHGDNKPMFNNNNNNNGPTPQQNGNPPKMGDHNPPPMSNHNPPPPMGDHNPPPHNGNWNFSDHDRGQFRQRFGGFNFGYFPVPGFSIYLGVPVPHSYSLKTVPYSVWKYYPQFRGYFYFIGRNGDFVIVSPSSHRVVAIL